VKLGDLVWVRSGRDGSLLGIVVNVDTYAAGSVPWIGVLIGDGEIHWCRHRGLRKIQ